jgi:hypothetical protein
MRAGLMVIWLVSLGIPPAAQVYQTQSGKILVNGKYKGTSVAAVSNHLHMQMNYDRAEIHMRLVVPTIITDNDSLNVLLQKMAGYETHYTGKMNISYVQTKSHPKQKFLTNGMMTINGVAKAFSFASTLEHISRGGVSCTLSGEFLLNLNEFGIVLNPGEDKITVRFNQLVLRRPGEQ